MSRKGYLIFGILLIIIGVVAYIKIDWEPWQEYPSVVKAKDDKGRDVYTVRMMRDWYDTGVWVDPYHDVVTYDFEPHQPYEIRIGDDTIESRFHDGRWQAYIFTADPEWKKFDSKFKSQIKPPPVDHAFIDKPQKIYFRASQKSSFDRLVVGFRIEVKTVPVK
jgi:hypothetical protein